MIVFDDWASITFFWRLHLPELYVNMHLEVSSYMSLSSKLENKREREKSILVKTIIDTNFDANIRSLMIPTTCIFKTLALIYGDGHCGQIWKDSLHSEIL